MRTIFLLGSYLFLIVSLVGCSDHKAGTPSIKSHSVPRVEVVGGGEFPKYLVGDWQCHAESWVIHFDEDGSLSWIFHPVGGIIQTAEGGSFEEARDNATFFAALGAMSGQYDPATQILHISIELERYEMVLPQGTLSGKVLDEFDGKVDPEKGQWQAAHVSIGWLEGADSPDEQAIRANPDHLVFMKEKFSPQPAMMPQ